MVITFSKPINWETKEYKEIELDFDSLTGKDLIEVGNQYNKTGKTQAVKMLDERYQILVAERVSGLTIDFYYALPAPEFVKVTTQVMGFLMGAD